ncbi:Anti-sigma-K factor rskA [Geodermatophilus telluris]|uniref:Anti-sigma-K factor rskA n=1 Tax=Geodermatophilus telluris TaxID=1190417 RepID=A0A1G6KWM7_9ACTN|nr:anti-sigma factor [Geodermatophilus telluris]SDC35502.1 Anti-sigma-K factor rskA [Geodermatophilus telluris]
MRHCTPEDLGLAALGEPLPADEAAHLAGCARCGDEVAALRRGVEALAVPELAAPGPPVAPPPGLWAGIAAATGVGVAPRAHVVAASAPPAGVPDSPPLPVGAGPVPPPADPPLAPVVPLRPRRSRVLLAAAAALVAGLAIGAGAVALRGGDDAGGSGVPVAAATLDPLAESDASGRAEVVERADGTLVLEVDLAAGAPAEGYYEAWLLTESVSGLIPLGVVRTGSEQFELPAGLDLGEYPVVDVSIEQLDGDPTHSGVSVARGQLA